MFAAISEGPGARMKLVYNALVSCPSVHWVSSFRMVLNALSYVCISVSHMV